MEREQGYGIDTLIQHYGEDEKIMGAVVPPIFQNSLFVFDTMDELADSMATHPYSAPHHYSRLSNPSLDFIEKKLAMLEGTDACKVVGCGQAALTAAVMSSARQGAHIVCVDSAYGPLMSLVSEYLARFGVTHTFVDGRCVEEVIGAIRPETTVIYLESPSSLIFSMQDFEAISRVARERGITTICDNTYSTPLFMKPHSMGIDIVCHSATKYIGGHSDLTAGVICTDRDRMDKIVRQEINLLGSVLHPLQAWMLQRSLRTLSLRMEKHQATGNAVASWLESQKEIAIVRHVGLPSYPQRDLYQKMMKGSGGLFSFEPVTQDPGQIKRFVDDLKLFQRGVSWGGFESLVVALQVHPKAFSEPKWLVRLFCGLENSEDLIADLQKSLPLLG